MPRALRAAAATVTVAFATAVAAACDSTTGPPASRMAVLSDTGVSDTILTLLTAPLVVRVLDEIGLPASDVPVRFEALHLPYPASSYGAFLYSAPDGPQIGTIIVDTTDWNGEARVWVRLGIHAGQVRIAADAPTLALSTTATYTVLPGAATRVQVVPADSAAYQGRGYTLRSAIVDRYGNARPDPVTYVATAPTTVDVDESGRIAAHAIGRGAIIAAAGTFRDTAWVSVVPDGMIAAHKVRISGDDATAVVFMGLDGSGYEERPVPYWAQPRPDWARTGDAVVMEDGGNEALAKPNQLVVIPRGEGPTIPVGRAVQAGHQFYPQYSPDGSWIYFSASPPIVGGVIPGGYGQLELWRVRPDGSSAERLYPGGTYHNNDFRPSVAPNGNRVVFLTNRVCCGGSSLMILDPGSGTVDTLRTAAGLTISGEGVRWSPVDNDLIAYVSTRIWLTSADGTTQRAVTPQGKAYGPEIDWSPDGRWIIARSGNDHLLHLIEVSSGLTLPLGFTDRLTAPAWHP